MTSALDVFEPGTPIVFRQSFTPLFVSGDTGFVCPSPHGAPYQKGDAVWVYNETNGGYFWSYWRDFLTVDEHEAAMLRREQLWWRRLFKSQTR